MVVTVPAPPADPAAPAPPAQVLKRQPPALAPREAPPPPQLLPLQKLLPFPAPAPPPPAPGAPSPPSPLAVMLPSETEPGALCPSPISDAPVLAANDRLLRIQERRAKLLGIEAPTQIVTDATVRYEIVGVDIDKL